MFLEMCPFCGNDNDFEGSPFPTSRGVTAAWAVRCGNPNCGAEVTGHTAEEAVKLWNHRVAPKWKGRMPDHLRDFIEGMSVSVDVSTGDHDSGNRYFGTVTEVMDYEPDKHGVTLLVQDAEPNFKTSNIWKWK